jgi:hypothetical protein
VVASVQKALLVAMVVLVVVVVLLAEHLAMEAQPLLTKEEMVAQAKATLVLEGLELVVVVVVPAVSGAMVVRASLVKVLEATAELGFHPQ